MGYHLLILSPSQWFRPAGVMLNGHLQLGLEVNLSPSRKVGRIQYWIVNELRPHTGIPETYICSPAFVNAHSHFEYRGMQDRILHPAYFEWIWELTKMKTQESAEDVIAACALAAEENYRTGVAMVGEHSDRIGSAEVMSKIGLGGWLFQEVLDVFDADPTARMNSIVSKLERNKNFINASLSPHAAHTVLEETLEQIAQLGSPISIHVNETKLENLFFEHGNGQIADSRLAQNLPLRTNGMKVVPYLESLGLLSPETQCVHVCDLDDEDIAILARTGAKVAHCPRSNERLKCPKAPIRELLDAGIKVGLGLDSPASSGEIDFFAEMKAALAISGERGRPLKAEEVWSMATTMGYKSFGEPTGTWDFVPGAEIPILEINLPHARLTEDLIEEGSPAIINWKS